MESRERVPSSSYAKTCCQKMSDSNHCNISSNRGSSFSGSASQRQSTVGQMQEFSSENACNEQLESKHVVELSHVYNYPGETDMVLSSCFANKELHLTSDVMGMDFHTTDSEPTSEDVNKVTLSRKNVCSQQTTSNQVHKYGSGSMLKDHMDAVQAQKGSRSLDCMCPQQCISQQIQEEKNSSVHVPSQSSEYKDKLVPSISQNELGDCSTMLSSCLIDVPIKYCTLDVLMNSITEDEGMHLEDGSNFRTILQSQLGESGAVSSESITANRQKKKIISGVISGASSKYKDEFVPRISEGRREASNIMLSGHLVNVPILCCTLNVTKNYLRDKVGTFLGGGMSPLENVGKNPRVEELVPFSKGAAETSDPETLETPSRNANEDCLGHKDGKELVSADKNCIPRSLVRSRSMSHGKSEPSESNQNVADTSISGDSLQKRRKRGRRGKEGNEYSRIQNHLRYLLHRMRYESNLIDAYSMEGWRGLSLDKLKPEKELQRAKSEITRCKLKIRDLFQHIDLLSSEGRLSESLFDSEGQIDNEEIFCAKCGSKDCNADNDIVLCDGACDRGFHQFCLEPPLLKEDIPPGDEGWLCPGCHCKVDCIRLINYSKGTNLSITDSWEKVFPEAARVEQNNNDEFPSDDSDDDYNPDAPDTRENHSTSDESDYASASDGLEVPSQDKSFLRLLSDDSEDTDYDPDCLDPEVKVTEEISSSDFTSASEDLGATLDEVEGSRPLSHDVLSPFRGSDGLGCKLAEKKLSFNDELASLQKSDPGQVNFGPVIGKRNVERLDYKKLYDETFANVPSESSDDEDWNETPTLKKNGARHVPSASQRGDISVLGDEVKSRGKKRGREKSNCTSNRSLQNVCMDNENNSLDKLHEDSSFSGSRSKRSRPSTYKKLGEAVTKRLHECFKENQYPTRAAKENLANDLGLTLQQVNKWFDNTRWSARHSTDMEGSTRKSAPANDLTSPFTNQNQLDLEQGMVSRDAPCSGVENRESMMSGVAVQNSDNQDMGKELLNQEFLDQKLKTWSSDQRKGKANGSSSSK